MELHELEVGQIGAGGLREQEPVADSAARVRGARPERGVSAGCDDDGRASEGSERRDSLALDQPNARVFACALRQDLGDVSPGVRAARMHDAGARVAALPTEAVVEADAEAAQLPDPGRGLLREQ